MGLVEWFRERREERAIALLKKHIMLTEDAASELIQLSEGKGNFEKIKKLENECDELRREIVREVTKEELKPEERADLADLAREMDKVTNYIYDASRHFKLLKPRGRMLSYLQKMCAGSASTVRALAECIDLMTGGDKYKALEQTNEVERHEEAMDEEYTRGIELLLREKGSAAEILLLRELILIIENISDACEHTCDVIRAILMREW